MQLRAHPHLLLLPTPLILAGKAFQWLLIMLTSENEFGDISGSWAAPFHSLAFLYI